MTLADAFTAFACELSARLLRRFMRWQVRTPANDNGGGLAA